MFYYWPNLTYSIHHTIGTEYYKMDCNRYFKMKLELMEGSHSKEYALPITSSIFKNLSLTGTYIDTFLCDVTYLNFVR